MRRGFNSLRTVAAVAVLFAAGCGSSGGIRRPATTPAPALDLPPPPTPPPAPVPQADHVGEAIARSQGLFKRGQDQILLGHLAQAKVLQARGSPLRGG